MLKKNGEKKQSNVNSSIVDTNRIYPKATKGIGEKVKTDKKPKKRVFVLLTLSIIILLLLIAGYVFSNNSDYANKETAFIDPYDEEVAGITTEDLNSLSSKRLNKIYGELPLPNLIDISLSPSITGDYKTDIHIQRLAEKRGYVLRSIPRLPIAKSNASNVEDEDLLQPLAYESWLSLKKEAKKDGVDLIMNSGYRSVKWQREYFKLQLSKKGVNLDAITDGSQDGLINDVMDLVAPPGYSKHHSGYTIDFACSSNNSFNFEGSVCWDWISQDNFAKAKKHNWIPSYPKGVKKIGPKPEPWEFVWIRLQ